MKPLDGREAGRRSGYRNAALRAQSLHGQNVLGRSADMGEPPGQRAHHPVRPYPYLWGRCGAGPAVAKAQIRHLDGYTRPGARTGARGRMGDRLRRPYDVRGRTRVGPPGQAGPAIPLLVLDRIQQRRRAGPRTPQSQTIASAVEAVRPLPMAFGGVSFVWQACPAHS